MPLQQVSESTKCTHTSPCCAQEMQLSSAKKGWRSGLTFKNNSMHVEPKAFTH